MNKQTWPTISIVTPSFNQGEFLERTILSVLEQNYSNLEYFVIDGGSTDESLKIIRQYQKQLTGWVSEPDQGQADAIGKGFKKATGEIMTWLNSDDVLMPGALEFVAEVFQRHPNIDWLTGQPLSIDTEGRIIRTGLHTGKVRSLMAAGLYHGKALGFIGQEGTFWRRKLWEKAGKTMPNYQYALDYFLWRKFAQHADLVTAETPLGAFRVHPRQKTHSLAPYYQEINPWLKLIPRKISLVTRVLHPLLLRRISPRLYYDEQAHQWVYSHSR